MRCDAVRERLPGYPDRELHPVGPVEVHLASCGACRAELREYRRLRELLSEMATTPAPRSSSRGCSAVSRSSRSRRGHPRERARGTPSHPSGELRSARPRPRSRSCGGVRPVVRNTNRRAPRSDPPPSGPSRPSAAPGYSSSMRSGPARRRASATSASRSLIRRRSPSKRSFISAAERSTRAPSTSLVFATDSAISCVSLWN